MGDVVVTEEEKPVLYRQVTITILLWLSLWVGVFYSVLSSAVAVWWSSATFNHCFFILPAASYFIWQQRAAIWAQSPALSILGSMAAFACVLLVLVGRAAHIDVIQHVAVFALLPSMVWSLLGWKIVCQIWFPLLFLLFAIPIGEELVPMLQAVTADIALYFLQLINVPVFRDGLYIMVPNGVFVVAEACSGISFFIACIVIGSAYAYMNFISQFSAILFVIFSLVLPIVANGIRVFGIIYIAHSTNMEYAIGADHLIYGGVFFAFVIIFLMIVGYFFTDGHRVWNNNIGTVNAAWLGYVNRSRVFLCVLPLLLAALMLMLVNMQGSRNTFELDSTKMTSVVEFSEDLALWTPQFKAADGYYIDQDITTGALIYRAIYQANDPGQELIYWSNRLYDVDGWSVNGEFHYTVEGIGDIAILNLVSTNHSPRLLAYWYTVPGINTPNKYFAKLQQAFNVLAMRPAGGAMTAVSLNYQGLIDEALQNMQQLLDRNGQSWQNQLDLITTE